MKSGNYLSTKAIPISKTRQPNNVPFMTTIAQHSPRPASKIIHLGLFTLKLTGNSIQKVYNFGNVAHNGLSTSATFYLLNKGSIVVRPSETLIDIGNV